MEAVRLDVNSDLFCLESDELGEAWVRHSHSDQHTYEIKWVVFIKEKKYAKKDKVS